MSRQLAFGSRELSPCNGPFRNDTNTQIYHATYHEPPCQPSNTKNGNFESPNNLVALLHPHSTSGLDRRDHVVVNSDMSNFHETSSFQTLSYCHSSKKRLSMNSFQFPTTSNSSFETNVLPTPLQQGQYLGLPPFELDSCMTWNQDYYYSIQENHNNRSQDLCALIDLALKDVPSELGLTWSIFNTNSMSSSLGLQQGTNAIMLSHDASIRTNAIPFMDTHSTTPHASFDKIRNTSQDIMNCSDKSNSSNEASNTTEGSSTTSSCTSSPPSCPSSSSNPFMMMDTCSTSGSSLVPTTTSCHSSNSCRTCTNIHHAPLRFTYYFDEEHHFLSPKRSMKIAPSKKKPSLIKAGELSTKNRRKIAKSFGSKTKRKNSPQTILCQNNELTSVVNDNNNTSRYRVRFGPNVFDEIMMEHSKQQGKEIHFVNSNAEEFQ
ncbi:hypothetical protein C9374_000435 [Naegleria lovaniensis]|uniref:Uncharacterized protein n=1 Tax=Naegleria lovaniensis TaxID=51637 RepID=A0AA88KP43_NAELO|nr:uncharacterized protein C9374_000435 [Naegleria lovaniensis]KAG2388271.1 hypothetical protein C9374_000435 [Naegleria lovaniensis]